MKLNDNKFLATLKVAKSEEDKKAGLHEPLATLEKEEDIKSSFDALGKNNDIPISQIASQSRAFSFLKDEPDIYGSNDLPNERE